MKLMLCAALVMLMTLVYVPVVQGFNTAQNICEYIAVDDKGRLRKLLKANRLKLRNVFKDTRCNNDNLLVFSAKNNANEIGQLLIKKLPKSVIENELPSLAELSPTLVEVAKARIN